MFNGEVMWIIYIKLKKRVKGVDKWKVIDINCGGGIMIDVLMILIVFFLVGGFFLDD